MKEGNDFQIAQRTAPALEISVCLDAGCVPRAVGSEVALSGRVTRGDSTGAAQRGVMEVKVWDAGQSCVAAD